MLMLPESVRSYLATEPADMRQGFDGLCALVEHELGEDVYSGHLFVFVSRRSARFCASACPRQGGKNGGLCSRERWTTGSANTAQTAPHAATGAPYPTIGELAEEQS